MEIQNTAEANTTTAQAEIQKRLQHLLPIRIVLQTHVDGVIEGLVEHSFAMDWNKERVCIFWSGVARTFIGNIEVNGIEDAKHNFKPTESDLITPKRAVFDPFDESCPIEIDWESWLACIAEPNGNKFYKRNARFKKKTSLSSLPLNEIFSIAIMPSQKAVSLGVQS